MLHRVVNGYTIVATREESDGYIVLGARRNVDGMDYVTGWMRHLDDVEWYGGHYFDYASGLTFGEAVADFNKRR